MATDGPVIIEAALNGITSRRHNPDVPMSPEELAAVAIECIDAGATVVHTHVPDPTARPEARTEQYAECYRAVLAERPGTILYPTTGIGGTVAERYAHVGMLASEGLIRASFVDPGSVNLGGTGSDGLPPPIEYVYANPFADIRYAFDLSVQHGLGPSVAVFEPGFLQVVLAYHEAGALPPGTLVKLYFAAGGYLTRGRPLWGIPPIAEGLDLYLAMLTGTEIPWAIAVVGGDAFDPPITRVALERGGHLRVGIEDDPDATDNRALVERAAALCRDVGRRVATLAETETILGLA
jgi:3-keto-5-aminohexanoate cleavage enzyme